MEELALHVQHPQMTLYQAFPAIVIYHFKVYTRNP